MTSDLIKAAKDGNLPVIKRIIYPGWIYPRMVLSRFYNKSQFGIRKTIAEFVGASGVDLDVTDKNGETALHWASGLGGANCVEILLKFGANINATDNNGFTALHDASRYGKPKCVEILLKYGADMNATDNCSYTAVNINAIGNIGWTALDWASSSDCVEMLLKHGAK